MTKYSLLGRCLWMRSDNFHPKMVDWNEYPKGYYPMRAKGNWMERKANYIFKRWNHMHISNRR